MARRPKEGCSYDERGMRYDKEMSSVRVTELEEVLLLLPEFPSCRSDLMMMMMVTRKSTHYQGNSTQAIQFKIQQNKNWNSYIAQRLLYLAHISLNITHSNLTNTLLLLLLHN